MAKIFKILAVLAVCVAVVCAEPPRYRTSRRNGSIRTNVRFLARQEAAPEQSVPAAPYPPSGVTPETPFELPTETEAPLPDETYGPPDATYGPPPTPDATYGPPPTVTEEDVPATPDETYGPPEEPAAEEIVPATGGDLVSANIIQPRQRVRTSAPLRQRSQLVEIIHSKPVLVYTLH